MRLYELTTLSFSRFDIGRRETREKTSSQRAHLVIPKTMIAQTARSETRTVRIESRLEERMWAKYLRKLADRIKAILLTPQTEWKVIEQEHDLSLIHI